MSDWQNQVNHLKDRQATNTEFVGDLTHQKDAMEEYGERMIRRREVLVKVIREADDEISSLESQIKAIEDRLEQADLEENNMEQ